MHRVALVHIIRQCSGNLVLVEDGIVLKDQIHVFAEDTWKKNRENMCLKQKSHVLYVQSICEMVGDGSIGDLLNMAPRVQSGSESLDWASQLNLIHQVQWICSVKKWFNLKKTFGSGNRGCEFTHAVYACLYTEILLRLGRLQTNTSIEYSLLPMNCEKCKTMHLFQLPWNANMKEKKQKQSIKFCTFCLSTRTRQGMKTFICGLIKRLVTGIFIRYYLL